MTGTTTTRVLQSTASRGSSTIGSAAYEAAVPPSAVRLTRRGRAAVVAVLALLLFGAFSLGRSGAEGSTEVREAPRVEQTVVQPGDTLWSVAKQIAPGRDPRPVVEQIRRLNELDGAGLRAGQQLLLPVAG